MSVSPPDPDYELKWPGHIFRDELRHLIQRARDLGMTAAWQDEVEQLLRQAFASDRPAEDFLQTIHPPVGPPAAGFDPRNDPF